MPKYLLIRVPKCGSTSLDEAFKAMSGPGNHIDLPAVDPHYKELGTIESFRAWRNLKRGYWRRYRCLTEAAMWEKVSARIGDDTTITGHLPYRSFPLAHDDFRLVTMVREPFARFMSDYKWTRHGYSRRGAIRRLYHHGRTAAAGGTPGQYFDYLTQHPGLYQNEMARFLLPATPVADAFDFVDSNYFCHGVLESMDDFMRRFEEKAGRPLHVKHLNTSPLQEESRIDQGLRRAFYEFNAIDADLYTKMKGDASC